MVRHLVTLTISILFWRIPWDGMGLASLSRGPIFSSHPIPSGALVYIGTERENQIMGQSEYVEGYKDIIENE